MLATVPHGYQPVRDRESADALADAAFRGLPQRQLDHYRALWNAALDDGLQQSGLLLLRLGALAPRIGLTSKTTPMRWCNYLTERQILHRVPGRLYPHGSRPGPWRTRSYLILRPVIP